MPTLILPVPARHFGRSPAWHKQSRDEILFPILFAFIGKSMTSPMALKLGPPFTQPHLPVEPTLPAWHAPASIIELFVQKHRAAWHLGITPLITR
jgi:hypothetical protein